MSCDWDIGERRNGKTTRLIERASEENLYIIVDNRAKAFVIDVMARDMGLSILHPVTVRELPFKPFVNAYRRTHHGVLVNDAESVLEAVIGMPVLGATACGKLVGGK